MNIASSAAERRKKRHDMEGYRKVMKAHLQAHSQGSTEFGSNKSMNEEWMEIKESRRLLWLRWGHQKPTMEISSVEERVFFYSDDRMLSWVIIIKYRIYQNAWGEGKKLKLTSCILPFKVSDGNSLQWPGLGQMVSNAIGYLGCKSLRISARVWCIPVFHSQWEWLTNLRTPM